MSGGGVVGTAAALRAEFDHSFAVTEATTAAATDDVLAVCIGGDAHAVLVSEIFALHADRKIVPLPSAATTLLGIAGFRSGLLPVFDLASLLGYPRASATRWLIVARGLEPVALAFETLDGHLRVPRVDVSSTGESAADPAHPFVRGAVRVAGVVRPLVHVAAVVEALTRRAGSAPKDG